MTSPIIYIHGANSSPTSFNHIKNGLPLHQSLDVNYDSNDSISDNLQYISSQLPAGPIHIIGHSLGGVLAVLLSQAHPNKVEKVVTLATPFGGSRSADYLKWVFPHYLLFDQISTKNKILRKMNETGAVVPTLNIVTHGVRSPLFGAKDGDGVVTYASQLSLKNTKNIELQLNHFEVLLSYKVIDNIQHFIWNP